VTLNLNLVEAAAVVVDVTAVVELAAQLFSKSNLSTTKPFEAICSKGFCFGVGYSEINVTLR
jgi:hypothetical protein